MIDSKPFFAILKENGVAANANMVFEANRGKWWTTVWGFATRRAAGSGKPKRAAGGADLYPFIGVPQACFRRTRFTLKNGLVFRILPVDR
jgi:hypothetical protein